MGTPVIVARTPGVEAYFDDTMVRYFEPDDVDDLADAIRDLFLRSDRRDALVDRSDEFNRESQLGGGVGPLRGPGRPARSGWCFQSRAPLSRRPARPTRPDAGALLR